MSGKRSGATVLRTVLFSVLGAFFAPLALSLSLRVFYCYACNHLYTLSESQLNLIWYVSDVLAETGVFFGIGLIAAGLSQKIRLSWLSIPVTVLYAAVCPILLYTVEYSSGIFLSDADAADGLIAAMSTLEAYYIYILVSLIVTFIFITTHTARENRGVARLGTTAGFFSPKFLPTAIGYTLSALVLLTVVISSFIVGNGAAAFLLSVLIALLRSVFLFLGIFSAGRRPE